MQSRDVLKGFGLTAGAVLGVGLVLFVIITVTKGAPALPEVCQGVIKDLERGCINAQTSIFRDYSCTNKDRFPSLMQKDIAKAEVSPYAVCQRYVESYVLAYGDETRKGRPAPQAFVPPPRPPEPTTPKCQISSEKIFVGDFVYEFQELLAPDEIPSPFRKHKRPKGAAFVQLEYTILNNGNQSATISTNNITLIDREGRKFEASSSLTTDLALKKNLDLYATQLQPGLPRQMVQVFEIPEGMITSGLKMTIESGKLFDSAKSALVCIN